MTKLYPTKDEMAHYIEKYAPHFTSPYRMNTSVIKIEKEGVLFILSK